MWRRAFAIAGATVLLAAAVQAQAQNPVAYPDSEKGLKQLIDDLHDAIKKTNAEGFRTTLQPLYFADNEAWFRSVFGERFGVHASRTYVVRVSDFANRMYVVFKALAQEGLTKPEVKKLEEPCRTWVLESEYPVLFARRKKVPIYSVRYRIGGNRYKSLGFFIYGNDGFRYIGHVDLGPVFKPTTPGSLSVGGQVQTAKLIHKPHPQYPEGARRARVQGTVRLEAIIGKDGTVQDLRLMSGNCWLAEASIEAVRRWRYSPTLHDGVPVEVFTTIDVIFSLH